MIGHVQDIESAKDKFESLFPNDAFLQMAQSSYPAFPGDSDDDMYAELENALSQLGKDEDGNTRVHV